MNEFEIAWDDFSRGDFDGFVERLMRPDSIFVDIGPGIGLACGAGVRPRLDMVLHLVMFDRRLRGRESLLKEIIGYFFDKLQLRRVTCVIGEDAKTALKLVSRLGFVHEGTMRHAILRGGKYIDAQVFGMLKEELEWPQSQQQL
jgi:hypothetical protein